MMQPAHVRSFIRWNHFFLLHLVLGLVVASRLFPITPSKNCQRTINSFVERISNGTQLHTGEYICSDDTQHAWAFGIDETNDLSLWHHNDKIWSAGTQNPLKTTSVTIQSDGNLVLRAERGVIIWRSSSASNESNRTHPASLFVRDGAAVITTVDGRELWSVSSCFMPPQTPGQPTDTPNNEPITVDPNDFLDATTLDGKVMAGYQGWFATECDFQLNKWRHWSSSRPGSDPTDVTFDMWPDLREFPPEELRRTDFVHEDGSVAGLYSNANADTINRHLQWMWEYGLHGIFVGRFVKSISSPIKIAQKDAVLRDVRAGAERFGRIFATQYDISSANPFTLFDDIKSDWMRLVDEVQITKSDRYLHHEGLPVVHIFGFGFKSRPGEPQEVLDLISWFKNESRYRATLIAGVPFNWRTINADAKKDIEWQNVYKAFDVLNPWSVGRMRDDDDVDKWKADILSPDLEYCKKNDVEYMPVVFPGFSWKNLKPESTFNGIPRMGGNFMWNQMYNAYDAGAKMLYVAMFDEVDEGTAIYKIAETNAQTPTTGNFVTLDVDGYNLPSDWYLRIVGAATQVFDIRSQRKRIFQGYVKFPPQLPKVLIDLLGGMRGVNSFEYRRVKKNLNVTLALLDDEIARVSY